MKNCIIILILFSTSLSFGQGFNEDKTAFSNFIKRMYKSGPFEGVKIVEDYEDSYLLSVLSLENAKYGGNESIMTRIAEVKAQSQANTFFNGSNIEMDMVISTNEKEKPDGSKESTTEMIEKIKMNSSGFVRGMEQLTNFDIKEGERKLFIYYRKME